MTTRTIMIFPELLNDTFIERTRRKYDPLAALIRPHITLVFPFESEISDEQLKAHLSSCLEGITPFRMKLEGISKEESKYGNYLLLNVSEGKTKLKQLQNALYTGILKEFDTGYEYVPHMTLGRLSSKAQLDTVYQEVRKSKENYNSYIEKVSVEMIGEHEESIIIMEYLLQRSCYT